MFVEHIGLHLTRETFYLTSFILNDSGVLHSHAVFLVLTLLKHMGIT